MPSDDNPRRFVKRRNVEEMTNYITAKQAAELWKITPRRVQEMCRNGEIEGVTRHGREWLIPVNATRRTQGGKAVEQIEKKSADQSIYGGMTDTYKLPGSAAEVMMSLAGNETAYDIFACQLYFYRGEYKNSIALAEKLASDDVKNVSHRIAAGIQLMLGSIYTGDIKLWRRGRDYIANTACENEYQKNAVDFWLACGTNALTDATYYPEWFKRGDFTRLPPNNYAVASYHYVKYLYVVCSQDSEQAIEIMHTMPRIIEPLISWVCLTRSVLMEIYLRLLCALAYHICGRDESAIPHIDRAISLALPDKLYTPFAEYRRRFGFLMDDRILLQSKTALADIKTASKMLVEGWTALHNEVLGKNVSSSLSTREWQAARLATYGLSNKEIAERMGVTVNAVKQALRMAMDKTGAESRSEIAKYL